MKPKNHRAAKDQEEKEVIPICESVTAIKQRINLRRRQSNEGFVRLNIENEEELHPKIERRKNKVINLGYQKVSHLKNLPKQRSLQLGIKSLFS